MARANNGGWDFVNVGETYQYKEDGFIAMVTILEDNSDKDQYAFKLRTEKSTHHPPSEDGVFEISHAKDVGGYYSGMLQIYPHEEYGCDYSWFREQK